jgi:hypothetical protein
MHGTHHCTESLSPGPCGMSRLTILDSNASLYYPPARTDVRSHVQCTRLCRIIGPMNHNCLSALLCTRKRPSPRAQKPRRPLLSSRCLDRCHALALPEKLRADRYTNIRRNLLIVTFTRGHQSQRDNRQQEMKHDPARGRDSAFRIQHSIFRRAPSLYRLCQNDRVSSPSEGEE